MFRHYRTSLLTATICLLAPFAAQAQGQQPALPEGAGKQLVEGVCTGCHQTNMITQSSGYTREGWKELTGTMINLSVVPEQQAAITDISRRALSAEIQPARRQARARPLRDHLQGMADADARSALA